MRLVHCATFGMREQMSVVRVVFVSFRFVLSRAASLEQSARKVQGGWGGAGLPYNDSSLAAVYVIESRALRPILIVIGTASASSAGLTAFASGLRSLSFSWPWDTLKKHEPTEKGIKRKSHHPGAYKRSSTVCRHIVQRKDFHSFLCLHPRRVVPFFACNYVQRQKQAYSEDDRVVEGRMATRHPRRTASKRQLGNPKRDAGCSSQPQPQDAVLLRPAVAVPVVGGLCSFFSFFRGNEIDESTPFCSVEKRKARYTCQNCQGFCGRSAAIVIISSCFFLFPFPPPYRFPLPVFLHFSPLGFPLVFLLSSVFLPSFPLFQG